MANPVEDRSSQLTTTPVNSPMIARYTLWCHKFIVLSCFILYNRQINTVGSCNMDPLSPVVGSSLVYPTSPMAAPLGKASPGLPSANSTPNKRVLATTTAGSLGQLGQALSSPLSLVSKVTGSPMGVKAQVISSIRDDQQPSGSSLSPIAPNTNTKQQMLTAQLAQLMQSNLTPNVLQSLSKIPLGKLNLNSLFNSTNTNSSMNATALNHSDASNSNNTDS